MRRVGGNADDRDWIVLTISMPANAIRYGFPLRVPGTREESSLDIVGSLNQCILKKIIFSSPNLQESRRLQALQDELASKLPGSASPKRHMDDLDALMSPRATTFTSNPFHDLLTVRPSEPYVEPPQKTPVTPTSSDSDPRSPAQVGISPITRNIFDVL